MSNDQWERIRDQFEIIVNTANYAMDCVDDESELREILSDIKRSLGTIVHITNE